MHVTDYNCLLLSIMLNFLWVVFINYGNYDYVRRKLVHGWMSQAWLLGVCNISYISTGKAVTGKTLTEH